MRKIISYVMVALLASSSVAIADLVVLDGTGASRTILNFVCATTKLCTANVLINSAGTEIGTASNPVRTDPTGTTAQPVSNASLPLPAGASTSALQPTNAAQGAAIASATGHLMQGSTTTASPTYTTATINPLSLDTTGALRVNVTAGGAGGGAVTVAAGADVTTGNTTDAACAGDATSGCTVESRLIRIAQNVTTLNTTAGAATPAGTNNIGKFTPNDGTNSVTYNPCQVQAHLKALVNIVTAANTKIVTGTASKKTYICGITVYPGGTTNFAIVEGSGTNCATSPLALIGGNTAATGIIATAQAGFVSNGGGYSVMDATVAANDVCFITSAAVQLSGVVDYVQQ